MRHPVSTLKFSGERAIEEGSSSPFAAGRLVAGIGFRRAVEADEIIGLVQRALALAGAPARRLAGIATAADRAGEPAIVAGAAAFGLAPAGIAPEAMRAADARVTTRSGRIEATRGVGSVAEAAALALAGADASLIVPRIAGAAATCALALAPEIP